MWNDYLEKLMAAILAEHGCMPRHKGTYFVQATTMQDETVWEGDVEVFTILVRGQSKTCYAWQHADDKGRFKIVSVLESQLVDSPALAVQAALFTNARRPVAA